MDTLLRMQTAWEIAEARKREGIRDCAICGGVPAWRLVPQGDVIFGPIEWCAASSCEKIYCPPSTHSDEITTVRVVA